MRDRILKLDDEKRLVYGEVYAPDLPDTDGDFMTAEEIEKMAHGFLRRFQQSKVDSNHDHELTGSVIVESYVARKGDDTFIPGSWVVGVHIVDEDLWGRVKKGEFNGFSMDAMALRQEVEVEMEIPEVIKGETQERQGHKHTFMLKFNDDGTVSGETDEVDGHSHKITRSTVTNKGGGDGHDHRFSYMEALVNG